MGEDNVESFKFLVMPQRILEAYWRTHNFICPVKMQTIEFLKESPVYIYVACYSWIYATFIPSVLLLTGILKDVATFSTEIEPIMKAGINTVAILFGFFRAITMGIAAYKAWRDRRTPEQGK